MEDNCYTKDILYSIHAKMHSKLLRYTRKIIPCYTYLILWIIWRVQLKCVILGYSQHLTNIHCRKWEQELKYYYLPHNHPKFYHPYIPAFLAKYWESCWANLRNYRAICILLCMKRSINYSYILFEQYRKWESFHQNRKGFGALHHHHQHQNQ